MSDELQPGPWLAIHQALGVKPPEFDDRPIGTFIEEYAATIPKSSALQYYDRSIDYSELNEQSNRLANALEQLGVSLGDVVGLHMPNVPQYVIAVVALSKLGAVASGISPLLAPAELAYQIENSQIGVLISLDGLAKASLETLDQQGRLPACLKAVVVTGADDLIQSSNSEMPALEMPAVESVSSLSYLSLVEQASKAFRQIDLPPDHVFLIQYTGGTTGKPKGAMLTLRHIMYNCLIAHQYRPWKIGAEVSPTALPPNHVGGLGAILWALRYGAKSVLIPNARDIDHYCQQLINHPPTRFWGVPTLYQMIADHPLSSKIDFSGLVYAQTGAAPITGESRKRIEAMLNGCVLADGYGMTEAGPSVIVNPPDRCKPDAVGIPIPGLDVRIVDVETGTREMPYGEAGEIIISGPCLMKGYFNQPEETANALRTWQGRTWMHTGDVGSMDEQGYVYLKDRAKDMIVVSGFKVFSVEVEDKLSALGFIANSALIGSPDPQRPGSEIVNLYVELTPEGKQRHPDAIREDILTFCQAEMTAYKVPKRIHIIDAIPLTAVGKIDKKKLRVQAAVN